MKALLLLCLYSIGSVGASHFFVFAPNVLRFNQDETVLVNVFGESNYHVEIWLQIGTREFSRKNVNVINDATPSTTTIKVTEDDLFQGNDDTEKPTEVTLKATTSKGTFSQKLLLSYNTGYIIMHTSKPMYHPKEEVLVRVLAMTEKLQFAKGWNISMDIIITPQETAEVGKTGFLQFDLGNRQTKSPSNLTFGRKTKVGNDKFFEDAFTLPLGAETGLWTIKAYYLGQYRTEGRTNFMVQDYVLPTFGVKIDVKEKVILSTTDAITIKVSAEYVYKKPVKGRAGLKISCLAEDGTTHSLPERITKNLEEDGTTEINITNLESLKGICGGFPALDGQRLHISADVLELATGHYEIASYKQTVFSLKKYKFSFENSKKSYRPGLSYYLRVLIKLANGDDPGVLDVEAEWNIAGDIKSGKTDRQGNSLMFFIPSTDTEQLIKIKIRIIEEGCEEESDELNVESYKGAEQIQIEQVIKHEQMIIKATAQGIANTGIMSLLLSRGQYLHHIFLPPATDPAMVLSEEIQEKIAPEARAVAFFMTSHGKLVADSTKFSLTPKCRGKGLELHTDRPHNIPGNFGKLTITGSPRMGVGLNVMDKALLLLDNNNVLRKSKMFEMMKAHDLGCGEGGGSTAEQVFREAGLTVVTNAILDSNILERKKIECQSHSRKKRSLECNSSNEPECCREGSDFAVKVLKDYEGHLESIDVETLCYGRTIQIAILKDENDHNKYSYACLIHHYKKCVEKMLNYLGDGITAKFALDSSNEYVNALTEYNININDIFVRNDFKESWLFRNLDLDNEGNSDVIDLRFPSSITDWMIQAIGISENEGFCISEPRNVTAFKDFFIQLDMPYQASRLEYFEIKATIFYYGNVNNKAEVKLFIAETQGLCKGLNSQNNTKIEMKANDAYSVRLPILALEAGRFPIKVIAIGKIGAISVHDAIQKELIVVNEGVEEREAITVCLNPIANEVNTTCVNSDRVIRQEFVNGIQTLTVNLKLPQNAIKDTGSAVGHASSNVMDDVVRTILSGIEKMFVKPTGCGEQTMVNLGPIVYVMTYWKDTKQMTSEWEQKGNRWIRDGVKNELTYRKGDGSYAIYLHRPSSTWLTAFVGKVFCQARKVIDDAVNMQQDVVNTISWLERKMDQHTGIFHEENPVSNRGLMGQVELNDPSLTAFVLITLSECGHRTPNYDRTKKKAMEYLENIPFFQYRQDPYLLAISTYALALTDSSRKYDFQAALIDIGHTDDRMKFMYWGSPNGYPANKESVETTSYAMLALMQFPNGVQMVGPVVRWLTHQRSASGSFQTTQDTIIGLQALSEYTIKTFSSSVKLSLELSASGWVGRSRELNNDNKYLLKEIKDIPVRRDHLLSVIVKGEGSGMLTIDYRYNRPQLEHEKCDFKVSNVIIGDVISVEKTFNRTYDVCGVEIENESRRRKRNANDDNSDKTKQYCVTFSVASLNDRHHGVSIIDVGLATGMQVVKEDLKNMKKDGLIDSFEMPTNEKGFFILYLKEITSEKQEFKFRLEDHFEGDRQSRQPSRIKVYEYYKPEYECIQFYGTGTSGKSAVDFNCDSEDGNRKETCSCLSNICPRQNMNTTLINAGRKREKPAYFLVETTCDFTKADFAVLMTIISVTNDMAKKTFEAKARIETSIHPDWNITHSSSYGLGSPEHEPNDVIYLYWRLFCPPTLFNVGGKYYLIDMAGDKSETEDGETVYKYHLSDSTIIVEWYDGKSYLQNIMKSYERKMKGGCEN